MTRGLRFAAVSADDLLPISALVGQVGWPHRPEDIRTHMELGQGLTVRDSDAGPVLGVGLWWAAGERAARTGLIVVAPQSQGRGIGRRLMQALLEDIGERSVLLVFGFTITSRRWR